MSAVSVDPTEALNKKYKELEEEYEKKRLAVEEEIARNDEKVHILYFPLKLGDFYIFCFPLIVWVELRSTLYSILHTYTNVYVLASPEPE